MFTSYFSEFNFYLIFIEKYDQIYSPWSCGVCTFDNLPYNQTKRDICEMCDAPSPLKLGKENLLFFLNLLSFFLFLATLTQ